MDELDLTESQRQLLARITENNPLLVAEPSQRLIKAGVTTESELRRWSGLIRKHKTSTNAVIRWRNAGISLPAIEQGLELQQYLQEKLALTEGIPARNMSIVALNGLLRKLGISELLADPETYPVSALDRLTTLLSAAARVFRRYPLQGLSYAINEIFDGNIEHAYQLCDSDEDRFVKVLERRQDLLTAYNQISTPNDSTSDPAVLEKLKKLGLDT